MDKKIQVLLVDDHQLFAQSLKMLIKNYAKDMEVVGIATDGTEAIDMARQLKPDVILMDVYMQKMSGVRATRCIINELPHTKIIMLSTYDEDDNVREALLSGASGYLLKDISPTELIISIRALQSGMIQVSPTIARSLVQKHYVDDTKDSFSSKIEKMPWYQTLSKREREIFALIATGYDNNKIAEALNISEQTVRNQVSTIYSKLGVRDRFEIIRLANQ